MNIRIPFFILSLLLLVFSFQSCKDSPVNSDPEEAFIYPLKVGYKWSYANSVSFTNLRPETLREFLQDTTIYQDVTVENEFLLDSLPVYELKYVTESDFHYYNYYSNKNDGYYLVGAKAMPEYNIKEIRINNGRGSYTYKVESDTIIYYDPPYKEYHYPLEIGAKWTYIPTMYPSIEKEVVGTETVYYGNKFLSCYKIKVNHHVNNINLEVNEYVGSKGLVKIKFIVKDLEVIGPDSPDILGYADLVSEKLLIKTNF
jgi:hypothetical protein